MTFWFQITARGQICSGDMEFPEQRSDQKPELMKCIHDLIDSGYTDIRVGIRPHKPEITELVGQRSQVSVQDLSGPALDWAVAITQGYGDLHVLPGLQPADSQLAMRLASPYDEVRELWRLSYSTDGALAMPLILRHEISVVHGPNQQWVASIAASDTHALIQHTSADLAEAAMRCVVELFLGRTLRVPWALLDQKLRG